MNILNKFSILTEVKRLDDQKLLLKFSDSQWFDMHDCIYAMTIYCKDATQIERFIIGEDLLNAPITVVEEYGKLSFNIGHPYEVENWNEVFSKPFDQWEGDFIFKTQEDWNNQLGYLIEGRVSTAAHQSTIDAYFRKRVNAELRTRVCSPLIPGELRLNLLALIDQIDGLDDDTFYSIFLHTGNSFDLMERRNRTLGLSSGSGG